MKVGGGLDREDGRALEAVKHLAGGHDGDRSSAHFGESGGQGFGGHELELSAGRIVALEAAGGAGRILACVGHCKAERLLEHLAGDDAVAQERGASLREVDHRGLDAELAAAAVEDHVELAFGLDAEVFGDVCGARRADAPECVGRRRREAAPGRTREGRDERMSPGMGRAAERHRVLSSRHPESAARLLLENERERARPVLLGQQPGFGRNVLGPVGDGVDACDVDDQRMVRRAALGRVGGEHCGFVVGVGGEAVDSFGRHGDEAARLKDADGFGDSDFVDGRSLGHLSSVPEDEGCGRLRGRAPWLLRRSCRCRSRGPSCGRGGRRPCRRCGAWRREWR